MEVRGSISDRPWGLTLGAIALRRHTGQLTLESDGKRYAVAFDDGAIVAATSPVAADAIARIALTSHFITSTQVADITRRLAASPERDEVDVLGDVVRFSPEQAVKLRLRLVAQRAARTFSVDYGDFVLSDRVALPVFAGVAVDHRHAIYLGVRTNLSEQRLLDDLRQLGSHFVLRPEAIEDLPRFGFEPSAQPVLDALQAGTSLPELEATHRELDPRFAQAIIYALVSCSACMIPPRTATLSAAIARAAGEADLPRTSTRPMKPTALRKGTATSPPLDPEPVVRDPGAPALDPAPPRKPTGTSAPIDPGRRPTGPSVPIEPRVARPTSGLTGPPEPTPAAPPRRPNARAPAVDLDPLPAADLPIPGAAADRVPLPEGMPPERPSAISLLVSPTSTGTHPPMATGTDTYPSTPEAGRTPTAPPRLRGAPATAPPPSGTRTTTSPFAARSRTVSPSAYSGSTPRDPGTNTPAATRTRTPSDPPAGASRTSTRPGPPGAGPRTSSRSVPPLAPEPARADTDESVRFTETPTPLPAAAKQTAVFSDAQPARGGSTTGSASLTARPAVPRAPTGDADPARGFADQRTPGYAAFADQRTPGYAAFADQRTPGYAAFADQRTPAEQRTPTDGGFGRTPTSGPLPSRVSTDNAAAAEAAFKRGELAMKRDQPGEAILEYKAACDLNPLDVDYAGMLAWAKFCAAGDKPAIGAETRKLLERAVFKSQRPERARFYLGRVERMLGRDKEALRHFQEVLDLKPNHADAAAEVRAIEARLAAAKGGGGLFGRKR